MSTTAALRIVDGTALVYDDAFGNYSIPLPVASMATPVTPGPVTIFNGAQDEMFLFLDYAFAPDDLPVASFSGDLQGLVMTAMLDNDNSALLVILRNDTGSNVTLDGTFYGFTMRAF